MSLKALLRLFKSSSFRFALLTGFTIWATTSAVLILVYFKLENTIWRSIDQNLDEQTEAILAQAARQPNVDISELIAAFNLMSQSNATIVDVTSNDMMAMHNTLEMQALHNAMGLANPPKHMLDNSQTLTSRQGNLQFTRKVVLSGGQMVSISQDIEYLNQLQTSLWQSLLFGLSITLFIAILGALLLTHRSYLRIHEIKLACKTIMKGNVNHRIPYKNPVDRFDDYDIMASAINQMLDEINVLFNKVKHVSDNIAHDLKSPLARLRAHLELANSELESTHLDKSISEVDRLLAMIKSLLGIARIESHNKATFEETNIDTLLTDLLDMYRPSFEDKAIAFSGQLELGRVNADRHLLFQAFANILENSLKFTPHSGQVTVVGRVVVPNQYSVIVQDSGPGINPDEMSQVLERFYREDKARNTAGFGLGLSLVQAIIHLHEGTISLENSNGLRVHVTLPFGDF